MENSGRINICTIILCLNLPFRRSAWPRNSLERTEHKIIYFYSYEWLDTHWAYNVYVCICICIATLPHIRRTHLYDYAATPNWNWIGQQQPKKCIRRYELLYAYICIIRIFVVHMCAAKEVVRFHQNNNNINSHNHSNNNNMKNIVVIYTTIYNNNDNLVSLRRQYTAGIKHFASSMENWIYRATHTNIRTDSGRIVMKIDTWHIFFAAPSKGLLCILVENNVVYMYRWSNTYVKKKKRKKTAKYT